MRNKKQAILLGLAVGVVVTGCTGVVVGGTSDPRYADSVARMVRLNTAMQYYISDSDNAAPRADVWMDLLQPYVQDSADFVSPAFEGMPGQYGYAMNVDVASRYMTTIEDPEHTLMLFDSTNLARNATTTPATMPVPGRYDGVNTRAFADGEVADEYPILRNALEESRLRMRRLGLGLVIYSADYDDLAPPATWMDGLTPYVGGDRYFHSPLAQGPNEYGYALNTQVAGASLQALPDETIAIFDSTDLRRNAVANPNTRPNPGRYDGQNTWATIRGVVGSGP